MPSVNSVLLQELYARLTLTNAFLVALTYFIFSCVYQAVHYRFFDPLSKFPGPFLPAVTRLWGAYYGLKERELDEIAELHAKYGPVVRVSPSRLHILDARMLPEIYHKSVDKSLAYISGGLGEHESIFNIRDAKSHAEKRKIIAGEYSFTNVKRMEPLIDTHIEEWIAWLGELFADTGKRCCLSRWALFLPFDVISDFAFGGPFGFTQSGSDVGGQIQSWEDGMRWLGLISHLWSSALWMKGTWLGKRLLLVTPESKGSFGAMMRFRDKLFEKRLRDIERGEVGRVDILQSYLDARDENGQPLDPDYIKAEILFVIIAGPDTTGNAIQSLLLDLLRHPDACARVLAEIDAATAAGHLSPLPQFEEITAHCPYFVACARETLRLTPSAPGISPRLVSKGGMRYGEWHLPEGAEVALSWGLANRDPKVYGEDAAAWRPERWLDEAKARELEKYIGTWGYGARVCIGKNIALMEIYKTTVQFLRVFEPNLVGPEPRKALYAGVVQWKDVWLEFKRRETAA